MHSSNQNICAHAELVTRTILSAPHQLGGGTEAGAWDQHYRNSGAIRGILAEVDSHNGKRSSHWPGYRPLVAAKVAVSNSHESISPVILGRLVAAKVPS